jgi:hypothetical protein
MLQPWAGACNALMKEILSAKLSSGTMWSSSRADTHVRHEERGDGARRTGNEYGVFDEATGKCVGTVSFDKAPRASNRSYPTRTIRLFDAKYIGSFNTHMESVAFVKDVEVVLNYMLKVKDLKSAKSPLNHMLEAKENLAGPEE